MMMLNNNNSNQTNNKHMQTQLYHFSGVTNPFLYSPNNGLSVKMLSFYISHLRERIKMETIHTTQNWKKKYETNTHAQKMQTNSHTEQNLLEHLLFAHHGPSIPNEKTTK